MPAGSRRGITRLACRPSRHSRPDAERKRMEEACYFSTWGRRTDRSDIGIRAGSAWAWSPRPARRGPSSGKPIRSHGSRAGGPIAAHRLLIHKHKQWLDGRFLCHRRRFVPLATYRAEHTA
jgi:hypothetical protein